MDLPHDFFNYIYDTFSKLFIFILMPGRTELAVNWHMSDIMYISDHENYAFDTKMSLFSIIIIIITSHPFPPTPVG